MYNENSIGHVKSDIKRVPTEIGESIEEMIRRCTESNEPIEATAPMIYTDKDDGVLPQYDIRTDRFDIALDAVDKYNASKAAESKETPKEVSETTKAPSSNDMNEV